MIVFSLGRDAALARAELRAVFPALREEGVMVRRLSASGVTADEVRSAFPRIGGTVKAADVVAQVNDVQGWVAAAADYLSAKAEGGKKVVFGISSDMPKFDRFRAGLGLKKTLKARGHNARFVNKANLDVATPIVLREKLDDSGTELHFTVAGGSLSLAATVAIQDIDAYGARDLARERDLRVGMLPPKLAQILLNLARGDDAGHAVWDPFAGLGTVLTEAVRAGSSRVVGGDLNDQTLQSARTNVAAAVKETASTARSDFYVGDVRTLSRSAISKFSGCAIVTEGYLGSPFGGGRVPDSLAREERTKVAPIYSEFIASLKAGGFRGKAVMCAPAWHSAGKISYLGIPAICKAIGVEMEAFGADGETSVVYRRPDQAVGREIFRLAF